MLGERLKKLRIQKGYTLVKLEQISGVSYVQIGRYEKGKAIPNGATIKKLADALKVNVESITENPSTIETIRDEELDEKYLKLKQVIPENHLDRRTLSEIFDLLMIKGSINEMLAKK